MDWCGNKAALAEADIPYDPELVRLGSPAVDMAETAAGKLLALDDRATAIFAANNRQCVGVLRAIRASQRLTALVGFDDFELADLLPIPVSVIAYDPGELADRRPSCSSPGWAAIPDRPSGS